MLKLPELNNQKFEDIVEAAVSRLALYGNVWSPTGEHEVGLTLIELFAFLKEQMQSSIDIVGSKSLYKFFPMLGLSKIYAQGASGVVVFSGDAHIPAGTKLLAGKLVFETVERLSATDTEIELLGVEKSPEHIEYIEYAALESEQSKKRLFEKKKPFYIGFSKPLRKNTETCLYFQVFDGYEIKRNAITRADEFIRLAELKYEYYGNKDGAEGWHRISLIKDETVDFLYSGCVSFIVDGVHLKKDGVYPVRIIPEKYDYDIPPLITGVFVNAVPIKQQDTKCAVIYFTYGDFKRNRMYFDCYIAFNGKFDLYAYSGNGWKPANQTGIQFMVKQAEDNLFRLGTSDREKLLAIFDGKKEDDRVLMLAVYENEFYDNKTLGTSTGMANQIYYLPEKYKNIVYDSFELMCGRTDMGQSIWQKTENLDASLPQDRHYLLNPLRAAIRFGDNRRGKVPPLGETNEITVVSLKTTMAEKGNVRSGAITGFSSDRLFKDVTLKQITPAAGGRRQETDEQAIARVRRILSNNTERAVTIKDYENIVRNAQGLMISDVTVAPSDKENIVLVVIEAYGSDYANPVPKSYVENITNILNKTKLITTRIKVCPPNYIGLDVYGEIVVRGDYADAKQMIDNCLKSYIDNLQKSKLVKKIYNIEVCGVLERLACVIAVRYIDWGTRALNSSSRQKHSFTGDLTFMPYEKAYLNENNILIQTSHTT